MFVKKIGSSRKYIKISDVSNYIIKPFILNYIVFIKIFVSKSKIENLKIEIVFLILYYDYFHDCNI